MTTCYHIRVFILTLLILSFGLGNCFATTYYAKPNASISTGTSWATATTLKDAINKAVSGDEIWVETGTYKPTTGTDRNSNFGLLNSKDGIKIYGGFDGTETLLSQRDYLVNLTVLSGDIGTIGNISDNSYNLFYITAGVGRNTLIDGFTLTNANNEGGFGGAISNNGSPTIKNCIFIQNNAAWGAAIFNFTTAFPYISNTKFQNNNSINDAGAIYNNLNFNTSFDPYTNNLVGFVIEDCLFEDNVANGTSTQPNLYGGTCIFNDNASGFLKNCIFKNNKAQGADSYGGALLNMAHGLYGGSNNKKKFDIAVENCDFIGNSAMTSGGAVKNSQVSGGISGRFTILNSYFENNLPDNINNEGNVTSNLGQLPNTNLSISANTFVCYGNNGLVQIDNSQNGVNYQLRNNSGNAVIVGGFEDGNGTIINLNTGSLIQDTDFNILAKDISTGVSIKMQNIASIAVKPLIIPQISFTAAQTSICVGQSATLTAQATNYDGTATYEWKLNGATIATNQQSTFTSTTFANGDKLSVTLLNTNPSICQEEVTTETVIEVKPFIQPQISFTAAQTSICVGQSATLTAQATNYNGTATYEWKLNGATIATNQQSTFTSTTFVNGDKLSVTLLNTNPSICQEEVTTETVIEVKPFIQPQISFTAAQTSICVGQSATLTAQATNYNGTATYRWKLNGATIATNQQSTFTSTTFVNGDKLSVTLLNTNPSICQEEVTTETVIEVKPFIQPQISLISQQTNICEGQYTTFIAQTSNYNGTATFEWKLNGVTIAGNQQSVFTSNAFKNGDRLSVTLLNTNPSVCQQTATTQTIINLAPVYTPSIQLVLENQNSVLIEDEELIFSIKSTNLVESGNEMYIKYIWKLNNNVIPGVDGPMFKSSKLNNGDKISVSSFCNRACISNLAVYSNTVTLNIQTSLARENSLDIKVFPNPSDGIITLDANGVSMDNLEISIYDLSGNLVYKQQKDKFTDSFNVDISKLEVGTYILFAKSGKTNKVQRIIKY